jgi:hypothetical protein
MRYTVLHPLKHNGALLTEGDVVEIDDAAAPSLLRLGLVSPVVRSPPSPDQTTPAKQAPVTAGRKAK